MRSLYDTIGFYTVKLLAIALITILYVIFGGGASILLDKLIPTTDPKKMTTLQLISYTFFFFVVIAILYYFLRIHLKHAPQVLDGFYGFDHTRLKEASGGIVIAYIIYAYHQNVRDYLIEIRNRIS